MVFPVNPGYRREHFTKDMEIEARKKAARETAASIPPPPADALKELQEDLGPDIGEHQKKLACNWKMGLGIAIGVLVGVLVLAIVIGACFATSGGCLGVLALLAIKLGIGTTFLAGKIGAGIALTHAHVGAAAIGWIAKTLSALTVATIFLGGGKLGGAIFQKGEAEQMNEIVAHNKTKELQDQPVTEEELQAHEAKKQATILSSQAGRNFVTATREAKLYYTGPADLAKKALGHFWILVPKTSIKSISDSDQYGKFCDNVRLEKQLKENSVNPNTEANQESLDQLNKLRATQIERLVWGTDAMGKAYSEAPEIRIYDRNIAMLEIQRDRENTPEDKKKDINAQIKMEQQKKLALIQLRLTEKHKDVEDVEALTHIVAKKGSPVTSLLTITEDIMALKGPSDEQKGLSDEQKGQILEAVSILLTRDRKTTIIDVNRLVTRLQAGFASNPTVNHWETRESVVNYAKAFSTAMLQNLDLPEFTIETSEVKAPMTRTTGFFLKLKVLDKIISIIHAIPVFGSSALAAVFTGWAVSEEKDIRLRDIFRSRVMRNDEGKRLEINSKGEAVPSPKNPT